MCTENGCEDALHALVRKLCKGDCCKVAQVARCHRVAAAAWRAHCADKLHHSAACGAAPGHAAKRASAKQRHSGHLHSRQRQARSHRKKPYRGVACRDTQSKIERSYAARLNTPAQTDATATPRVRQLLSFHTAERCRQLRRARTCVSTTRRKAQGGLRSYQPPWSAHCRSSSIGGCAPYTSLAGMFKSSTNTTYFLPATCSSASEQKFVKRLACQHCCKQARSDIGDAASNSVLCSCHRLCGVGTAHALVQTRRSFSKNAAQQGSTPAGGPNTPFLLLWSRPSMMSCV